MDDFIVGLAGRSKQKRAGAKRAMNAFGIAGMPVSEDVTSIVPDQPWGLLQTTQGADHRAKEVERIILSKRLPSDKRPDSRYIFIGAENGIEEIAHDPDPYKCCYVDQAVVTVRHKGVTYRAMGEGIVFPAIYVVEAKTRIAAGEKDLTVGKVITEHLGGDHADPHLTLTSGLLGREDTLYRAMYAAFVQIPHDVLYEEPPG